MFDGSELRRATALLPMVLRWTEVTVRWLEDEDLRARVEAVM